VSVDQSVSEQTTTQNAVFASRALAANGRSAEPVYFAALTSTSRALLSTKRLAAQSAGRAGLWRRFIDGSWSALSSTEPPRNLLSRRTRAVWAHGGGLSARRSTTLCPGCRSQSLAPLGAPPLIPVGCGVGGGRRRWARAGPTCGRRMTTALPHAPTPHRLLPVTSTIPLAVAPPPSPCPPPPRVAPTTLARAHRHAPAPHHGVREHLCRRRRHRRCPWVWYVAFSCLACCVWAGRAIPFCSLMCDAALMASTLFARVHDLMAWLLASCLAHGNAW